MTDLKPEDLVARITRIIEARRARIGFDMLNGFGDNSDTATVEISLTLIEGVHSLLADRARMEKAHQRLVDELVAKANEARALAADLHNKPAKAHLADPALGRMAYAMAAKCDHFIEAAEIARQALGASQ